MDPITNIALLLRGWLRIQKDLVTGLPLNSWSKRFLKTFILRFLMIPQTQQHAKLPPKHVKIAQFSPPKNYSQFLHLKQLRGCWLAASLKLVLKGFFFGKSLQSSLRPKCHPSSRWLRVMTHPWDEPVRYIYRSMKWLIFLINVSNYTIIPFSWILWEIIQGQLPSFSQ